ncbi:unnamed protein product [Didymodactylos carnosus]|uniref:Uncharacterized protein n=1 Tax=Didymodactylos carnosus TaxID=1234261 RepID=A0A814TAY8_9BILA|nr:unnamed protein product [Didymodactylos carnosus]CAF1159336.1 unnamed protein product [Didymodactylos carnosus]CAF3843082.1 unnamed protein product [Didymodactylos carnosus]CAF3922863.1 unnamed protein product [Didymodactylos carnosus]
MDSRKRRASNSSDQNDESKKPKSFQENEEKSQEEYPLEAQKGKASTLEELSNEILLGTLDYLSLKDVVHSFVHVHALLSPKVILVGQNPHCEAEWLQLKQGVHYAKLINLAEMFKAYNPRYSNYRLLMVKLQKFIR